MAGEKRLIVDQLKLAYDGIFDLPGLYRLIDQFFYDRSWDKWEKMNTEQVLPKGRQIKIEITPWKSITDYFKINMRVRIHGVDIKSIEVERDGAKVQLNEGKVMIIIDGYVTSDKHGRWESTPLWWFLRVLSDKYILKGHYFQAEQWLLSDVDDIYLRIKSFLNVYKYHQRGVVSSHTMA